MKHLLFIIISACVAMGLVAQNPRLSRSQLTQAPMTKESPEALSLTPSKGTPLSLTQVLKERNLSLGDNRIAAKAKSGQSFNQPVTIGSKIASFDVYDFDWDNENAIAVVNDTSRALAGKYCTIDVAGDIDGLNYLTDFYGEYEIPVLVGSGTVTLPAGCSLDELVKNTSDISEGIRSETHWVLYAMPLSWLTGESDEYGDIQGVVHDDGSITFDESFGFLVKKTVIRNGDRGTEVSWGLSPIFTNLVLFQPNATHVYSRYYDLPTGGSDGGVVVVTPPQQGMGGGGTIPKPIRPGVGVKAGTTKPISQPRQFEQSLSQSGIHLHHANANQEAEQNMTDDTRGGWPVPVVLYDDIYLYQMDDTTLMVYNLFGSDYSWNYMNIDASGNVTIPAQPISVNSSGETLYNCSGYHEEADTLVWGNNGTLMGNRICWGNTCLCAETSVEGVYRIESTTFDNYIMLSPFLDLPDWSAAQEGVTVQPDVTAAYVAWCDTVNTGWQFRYRPFVDTSGSPYSCDLNVEIGGLSEACEGWWQQDEDGDFNRWHVARVADNDYCFMSINGENLNPCNWLVSPEVKLQGVLEFTVWALSDATSDTLTVYAMEGENGYSLYDLYDWLVPTTTPTAYTFDLSDFGDYDRIAFLHYGSQTTVCLDNIFIGDPDAEVIEPAEWTYVNGLTEPYCLIEGLDSVTTYEVSVRAFNSVNDFSAWSTPVAFTTIVEVVQLRGDVNNDGKVSIADVTALINGLLSDNFESTSDFNYDNADCNQDGEVKIGDVTALINYLLSGSW